ncbi:MAG: AraC family transcriptional regulator [Hydrogenophaga sp.]|uniref:helix-turn-helix domain-containing protein n=1 Tax=Hydrogenophaga sp. TaxID=1904254 RepID=UPI0027320B99|nr:AraC family transcriptional regulator [Hydrogenophaga sp.]MDP2406210.1 AraC family transcriptional regulator [Hydrogenophaga sp.]MDZ4174412.1 AraC family transcriptional regulator [Hydrogenophaga sp.]
MRLPADALSVRCYGASHGSHAHDHFQILLGLDGVLELEVNGRGRRIAAGDGVVIDPGDRHDFEASGSARCLVLDSRDARWQHAHDNPKPRALAPLASYLAAACDGALPRARLLGPALLLEAWTPPATVRIARRAIDWAALTTWAQAHGHETLQVGDLASRVYLSAAQFTARCREDLGQSPMAWLRELRLAEARRFRSQGLPVAEVARRTGYRSPSALTAALRKQAGH